MTSALEVPPVADLRASTSSDTLRGTRIANNAVADSENDRIKGKVANAQIDNFNRDNYLANLMYCLPISESLSLPPETTTKEKTRTTSSVTTSATTNSTQSFVSTSSLGSSALGNRDHTTPKLPTLDASESKEKETKPVSLPHTDSSSSLASSALGDRDKTTPNLPAQDAAQSEETKPATLPHPAKCGCGCVPNTPSLFEMAELRRQYRLRQKNASNS